MKSSQIKENGIHICYMINFLFKKLLKLEFQSLIFLCLKFILFFGSIEIIYMHEHSLLF